MRQHLKRVITAPLWQHWHRVSGPEALHWSNFIPPALVCLWPRIVNCERIRAHRVSSWVLLASAKEFTGARYCSWMGRREAKGGRGREQNWQGLMGKIGSASTQALTSSEETSPRRICDWTHSTQRHSRPAIFEPWVSCYEQNVCRRAQPKSRRLVFVPRHQRAPRWPAIYPPDYNCFDSDFWTSPHRQLEEYFGG